MMLYGEAKEILDYARQLKKEERRNYNTSIEQATLGNLILEKAEKLCKDLGLDRVDWSGNYADAHDIDEFIKLCVEQGAEETEASEMYGELNYKYSH